MSLGAMQGGARERKKQKRFRLRPYCSVILVFLPIFKWSQAFWPLEPVSKFSNCCFGECLTPVVAWLVKLITEGRFAPLKNTIAGEFVCGSSQFYAVIVKLLLPRALHVCSYCSCLPLPRMYRCSRLEPQVIRFFAAQGIMGTDPSCAVIHSRRPFSAPALAFFEGIRPFTPDRRVV